MLRFEDISDLLRRFEYEESVVIGFCYFLGATALAGKKGETTGDVEKRLTRLPKVDINGEYETLLGPLRDVVLNRTFDELVWRFHGNFQVREIRITENSRPIMTYEITNNGMIFEDDRKVENLKNAEDIFSRAMHKIGQELVNNSYDPTKAFKTGVCAANLRAQSDYKATAHAGAHFDEFLPLIFSAANRFTKQENLSWSGHVDIQVPLQQLLSGLPSELGQLIWDYQSYVLFKDGALRPEIEQLEIMPFMDECKAMVLRFFRSNPEYCNHIASKKDYRRNFPHLSKDFDERPIILKSIKDAFGYDNQLTRFSDQTTLKALIIFGYFCSLCETIIFENQSHKLN